MTLRGCTLLLHRLSQLLHELLTILIIEQVLHGLAAEACRLLHLSDCRLRFGVSHRLCRLGGRSVILNAERVEDTLGVWIKA